MIGVEKEPLAAGTPFDRKGAVEALDRGELLKLIAEVEAGRMSAEDLEAALSEQEKSHWFRRFVRFLLGR